MLFQTKKETYNGSHKPCWFMTFRASTMMKNGNWIGETSWLET